MSLTKTSNFLDNFFYIFKLLIKRIISFISYYQFGQFYGWKRTTSELEDIVKTSGFSEYKGEFYPSQYQDAYLITAKK